MKYGICFVAFFNPYEEIVTTNITTKSDNAYILLADDSGYITNISSNYRKRYVGHSDLTNDSSKVQLDELF
jgi:hypothetical protein